MDNSTFGSIVASRRYAAEAVGSQGEKAPINYSRLVAQGIEKANDAIRRDEISSDSVEDGLEHVPCSTRILENPG